MTSLCKSIQLTRPAREVFEYVTNPAHWDSWDPICQGVKGKKEPVVSVGERVKERVRFLRARFKLCWVVRECEAPKRWIADADHWAFRVSMAFHVRETSSGSYLERELRYEMKNHFLNWLDRRFFTAQMEEYAQDAIEKLEELLG